MNLEGKQQMREIAEQYQNFLSEVNLLLLKEHQIQVDKQIYESQLRCIQRMIEETECGRKNENISSEFEEKYLRKIIMNNSDEIIRLNNKIKTKQGLMEEAAKLQLEHKKYLKIIQSEFQNSIQQKLSTIRGKVDELKKKIKQINKEIISLEQEHFDQIDQYSLNLKLLDQYKAKNSQLKLLIEDLKNR